MSIDFGPSRWEKIKENYSLWWDGKLDRPLIPVVLKGKEPKRSQPDTPLLTQETCHILSIPAEALIDRIDYELSKLVFIGDAYPFFSLDVFGPGIVAAFLGAVLDNSTGRVWFHPDKKQSITDIHFEYDANNVWLNRIKEICSAAMNRWQGQVLVGMPDLGGVLDVLSVFCQTENLLLDLFDYPEEVIRLTWEIHELWHRFYNEINEILQPVNPGYSDWSQIYSDKPSYITQSDFSYMISPLMFNRFAKPELEATCQKLFHTIYHLDGVGQLAHLDSILAIEELDAIQWIPGDGKPDQAKWPEVYQKIHNAGKKIQLTDGFHCLDMVTKQIGTYKGIHHITITANISERSSIQKRLLQYGVE